jgi:hypothetical protein
MKFDSKYFDCVRVKPDQAKVVREEAPLCQWKGCTAAGVYRAPRGRGREGEYHLLCLDHVREFNASYNYFAGMSNSDIETYQKDSVTGQRPTWKGGQCWATARSMGGSMHGTGDTSDPHGSFPGARQPGEQRRS